MSNTIEGITIQTADIGTTQRTFWQDIKVKIWAYPLNQQFYFQEAPLQKYLSRCFKGICPFSLVYNDEKLDII